MPDFQRDLVWKPEQIEQLLLSILNGLFSGTLLWIEINSSRPAFGLRSFHGASTPASLLPHTYAVLDGQQRMGAVYYAFTHPNVPLPSARSKRYYFFLHLDALASSSGGLVDEEAIEAVPAVAGSTKLNTLIQKWIVFRKAIPFGPISQNHIPPNLVSLYGSGITLGQLVTSPNSAPHNLNAFLHSNSNLTNSNLMPTILGRLHFLLTYQFHIFALPHNTPLENIVTTFTKINLSGTKLSTFDLAVAVVSSHGVNLRHLWSSTISSRSASHFKDWVSKGVIDQEDVLKVIALIVPSSSGTVSVKSADVLGHVGQIAATLKGGPIRTPAKAFSSFNDLWDEAVDSLDRAVQRLQSYGVFQHKWIPYRSMIVPLAALLHMHKHMHRSAAALRRIDCWYWHSVLYERYDKSVDTTTASDFKAVEAWMGGGSKPPFITGVFPAGLKLRTLNDPRSAVYRGIMNLIALRGALDLISGVSPSSSEDYEDDHLFPKKAFGSSYPSLIDSILNRTLITKTTNRKKGALMPSDFYNRHIVPSHSSPSLVRHTMDSHLINQSAELAFASDNFWAFIHEREKEIKAFAASLLGKC